MLSLDEAIEQFKYDAECNRADLDLIYAEDNEQVAEWLEELKAYRENSNGYNKEDIELNRKAMYNKAIDDFADYLRMSYDKGMRLSVAMCKNEVEKFKLKALYSRFINAIDDCVKAFKEIE